LDTTAEDSALDELEHERSEGVEQRAEPGNEARAPEPRAPADTENEQLEPLFEDESARKFRARWLTIQGKFVDNPRDSVKQADDLVADIIKSVTMNFADRRISLEKHWNSGENISTEDLRLTLKRYRSFFERLLSLES
jgi:hypothetical protein